MKGEIKLHFDKKKISAMVLGLLFAASSLTMAASLSAVRFHSGAEHDRVVFDLSELPSYESRISIDGRELTLDFSNTDDKTLNKESFTSQRIEKITYKLNKGHLLATIRLKAGYTYEIKKLANPARIFVDVIAESQKSTDNTRIAVGNAAKKNTSTAKPVYDESNLMPLNFDGLYNEMMAPGIMRREYVYWDEGGKITAFFVEADSSLYKIKPVLARNVVPGLATTSKMSDDNNAVAAINGTYFALNGDMIGMVKMDDMIAGTTYYNRSAVAEKKDGSLVWGRVSYNGSVTLGGIEQPVSGVDAERGENNLIIYNKLYGARTKTNDYGKEYTVQDGKVTEISNGNSAIPDNGYVISVHGTAAEKFKNVQVGDSAVVNETLGEPWDNAVWVMGAGPRLVTDGKATNTAALEEFPADIRVGRAPRSAVAITKNGNYLFAVVDGRQSSSKGLTLNAWANLLVKLGAYNAINLDGGGSSALVIGGVLQNSPSDGHERNVGSGLIIEKK